MSHALSTSIPQDVINEIIEHLQDDMTTLQTCSLASHSTYEPTRKHIFATITLACPDFASSLIQTLEQNSKLSTYIRSLKIPELDEDTLLRHVPILPALAHTRRVILGKYAHIHAVHVPSAQVLLLLSTVLQQLPHLTALEIHFIRGFPASHLAIAQGLETLSITNSPISRGTTGGTTAYTAGRPLLQLRSLYLARVWYWEAVLAQDSTPIVDAPNLREITIATPKRAVQPVIQAGAESIETVFWVGYVRGRVDLGVLRNLRRLCFVLSGGEGEKPLAHDIWDPINKILYSGAVSQSLEEISFIVKRGLYDEAFVPILRFVGQGNIWADLADKRQFPRLARVVVRLVNGGHEPPVLGADVFRSAMGRKVPLLVEAGLLHTAVHEWFDWHNTFSS